MPGLRFYLDEMMPRAVFQALQARGIVAVMANDVGMTERDDMTEHLTYATANEYVLVTADRPFAGRASQIEGHCGLICWTGRTDNYGGLIRALVAFAEKYNSDAVAGRVF